MADALREALATLRAHKGRALLTLFGITWGTASVIFLTGWGDGVRVMMERGFFKAGRNLGEAWAGRIGEEFTPAVDRRWLWFVSEDLFALRERAQLSERVGGESWAWAAATFGSRARHVDLRGVDPEAQAVRGVPLAAGRPITQSDLDHRRRVVVLGDELRRTLLGPQGGVGSWIRLDGRPFQVVGVHARVGVQLSQDRMLIDKQIWAPLTTVQLLWPAWWTDEPVVSKIVFRIRDRALVAEAKQEVRAILAERLGVSPYDDEAVGIFSPLEMLNRFPLDESRGLMLVLAVTTLGVGGIGVLSMMLDAVHERRQEIGVRMALGATRGAVVRLFFVETFAITALGGLAGAALGVAIAWGLGRLEVPDLVPLPVLKASLVWVALAVMTMVGVAAGVVPAWRAARVDPAVTLRME
ncbi:MAG: ABC transporter permease [Deltaproteobacteria bacterium]|nr:ABC transporter permease [Deltaproteobacteria bacterium]